MKQRDVDVLLFEANGNVEKKSPTLRQCGIKSLALKSLEAFLKNKGFSVEIVMQDSLAQSDFIEKLLSFNPKIVGATATTCEIPITANILKLIKNNKIITLVGGYHVSACPETIDSKFAKQHGADTSGIDLLILGEGEVTLRKIAEKVIREFSRGEIFKTKGIAYYDHDKREVVINPPRERVKNLDLLSIIRWSQKELVGNAYNGMMYYNRNKNVVAVTSERGCIFGCTFCATKSTYGNTVATKPIKSLVNEIEFLVRKRGVGMIVDYAPTSNRNTDRIIEFCDEVRQRGLKKMFSMYMLCRLQTPKGKFMVNEEIIKNLSEVLVGLKIGFGIEALSEEDEMFLKKNRSVDYVSQVSEWVDKYGALLRGFYMITPETSKESIVKCKTEKLTSYFDDLRITYLTPFPGTQIFKMTKKKLLTRNWSDFTCEQPVIKSNNLSEEELENAQFEILQNFLLNPYRQKRIRKKILAFNHLEKCFMEYNAKMVNFGFKTLPL